MHSSNLSALCSYSALRLNPARGPRWSLTWLACLATALSFVRGFMHWQSRQEVGSHPAAPWEDDHQLAQLTAYYRMVCVHVCVCACMCVCVCLASVFMCPCVCIYCMYACSLTADMFGLHFCFHAQSSDQIRKCGWPYSFFMLTSFFFYNAS